MGRAGVPPVVRSETNIYQNSTNIPENGTDSSRSSQVWSKRYNGQHYCCEFLPPGVVLKTAEVKEKSEVKVTFSFVLFFPHTLRNWQSDRDCEPVTRTKQATMPLRLVFFNSARLRLHCIALLRFIRFEWSDMTSQTSGVPETVCYDGYSHRDEEVPLKWRGMVSSLLPIT